MRVLILGGSPRHFGGVEEFCDRSEKALEHRTGWQVFRMPANTAYMRLKQLPNLVRGWARLLSYKRLQLDCIWIQYASTLDLTYLIWAKLFRFKVMVTPHIGSNARSQTNPMLRILSGMTLRLADRLALISPTQEIEVNLPRGVPRSPIRTFLPSSALQSATREDDALDHPTLRLIHSGRLSEGKGTFLFVDVCACLRAKGVPFSARIIGSADEKMLASLRAHISGYGLEDKVTVLGRVPNVELLKFLCSSDFLIHLSRLDSYPLIVLEALLCSVIPVCIDLPGARNITTTYGGHVVSMAESVEETVKYLASQDLSHIRRLGPIFATQVRSDYAWHRCAATLEAALLACCEGQSEANLHPLDQRPGKLSLD
jgi:glycosyltransferase involved in cell wall biosynthesis